MQEGAGDVGLHLPFPFLAAQVDQILVEDAAGIVHEDVELAERIDRERHGLFCRAVDGNVGDQRDHAVTFQFLDRRVDILGDDLGAARMQQFCDGAADTTGGPGHEGDLALDFVHGRCDVRHDLSPAGA